jgi:hypothetical protein
VVIPGNLNWRAWGFLVVPTVIWKYVTGELRAELGWGEPPKLGYSRPAFGNLGMLASLVRTSYPSLWEPPSPLTYRVRQAPLLSFQKLLQLITVKAHDNLAVNHGDRCRHVAKLLQFVQRRFIGGNVSTTNSILLCERNSFTFPQTIQPG